MESILAELFKGEVMPIENLVPKDPDYPDLTRQLTEERAYFNRILSKDDIVRLDKLEDISDCISDMENTEAFSRGFRLAAMIFIEVLQDKADMSDVRRLLELINNKVNT